MFPSLKSNFFFSAPRGGVAHASSENRASSEFLSLWGGE